MNFSWEPQLFDSGIFGFSTAKINFGPGIRSFTTIEEILIDLRKNGIAYATFRIPANNFSLVHELEKSGFLLVDEIIALEADLSEFKEPEKEKVLPVSKNDWKELIELAQNCFYLNRFYNDPVISKNKADKVFALWMENSFKGKAADEVLVFKEKEIYGFITLQKSGHIPLIGVKPSARGKGIARQLVLGGLGVLAAWGAKKAVIETQATNIPAIRSYSACGFKVVDSFLTFRWSTL